MELSPEFEWKKSGQEVGESPPGRYGHATAIDKRGDMYIFGGLSLIKGKTTELNDFWKYSCSSHKWENLSSLNPKPNARSYSSLLLIGKNVYLFGGKAKGEILADIWCYDLILREWNRKKHKSMRLHASYLHYALPRREGFMVLGGFRNKDPEKGTGEEIFGGQVTTYFGVHDYHGNSCENIFNVSEFSYIRYRNEIIIFGGVDDRGIVKNEFIVFDSNHSYTRRKFITKAKGRRGHRAILWQDRFMIIYGGLDMQGTFVDRVEVFDLESALLHRETYVPGVLSGFPQPRSYFAFETINNVVVIFGGKTQNDEILSDLQVYEFRANLLFDPKTPSPIEILNIDCLTNMSHYLTDQDIQNLANTSLQMKKILEKDKIWRTRVLKYFPQASEAHKEEFKSSKEHFFALKKYYSGLLHKPENSLQKGLTYSQDNINGMEKFKICLLGESYVGKSSIMYRFVHDEFYEDLDPTIEDILASRQIFSLEEKKDNNF